MAVYTKRGKCINSSEFHEIWDSDFTNYSESFWNIFILFGQLNRLREIYFIVMPKMKMFMIILITLCRTPYLGWSDDMDESNDNWLRLVLLPPLLRLPNNKGDWLSDILGVYMVFLLLLELNVDLLIIIRFNLVPLK